MKKLLAVALSAALSIAAMAIENQKVTLDVSGTFCSGCAGKLTAALTEGGLKPQKLEPNKTGPARTVAEGDKKVDLGEAAEKVNKAQTPHRSQQPPALSIVLFAKLDKDSAKKAEEAAPKEPPAEEKLLTEIRDLLRAKA